MRYLLLTLAVSVVSGLSALPALGQAPSSYQSPLGQPIARQHGVLLLRNGQMLVGEIALIEDRYSIVVARGEVRLPRREVECICRDLEEAYAHRRLQTEPDCVQDHLDLAEWCQTNGLFGHAGEELRIAATLNPNHPLIPLIDRKIRMALEQQTAPASQAAASAPEQEVSIEELDRMVRGLPNGSVELFTQTIQPMLINTCATAGCHGPASDDTFRLLRVAAGQSASRRMTQRNLHATLKLVRWGEPANSPLLTVPIQPHGGRTTPIFSDRQMEQYQHLVRWTHFVALGKKFEPERRPKSVVTATHEEAESSEPAVAPASFDVPSDTDPDRLPLGNGILSAVSQSAQEPSDADHRAIRHAGQPWGGNLPGDAAPSGENPLPKSSGSRRATPGVREGSELRGKAASGSLTPAGQAMRTRHGVPAATAAAPDVSADPFDPTVFNRRYAPQPPVTPSEPQ